MNVSNARIIIEINKKWKSILHLTKPEIISEAWQEHNEYLAETNYYHPIPADLKVPTFKDLYGIEPEAVPGVKK